MNEEIKFCTECDSELENFCFSADDQSELSVKQRMIACIKSGKFSGEYCSMFFIISSEFPDLLFEDPS